MQSFLGFEDSIAELEGKMEELRHLNDIGDIKIADEVSKLQDRIEKALHQTYSKLSSGQKVQVARHPNRPHCVDYIDGLVDDFTPLAGDRAYSEDAAILGGIGRFRGRSVVIVGQEKGNDTETRVKHNFGMARPEGYRKAMRLMDLAQRFDLPVVTFVDTPGAYPGLGAEERGQAEAIARSIEKCLGLTVPIVSVVIGEGGSGALEAPAEEQASAGPIEAGGGQAPMFEVDPLWPKPLPNHWLLGSTIGVDVDAQDHVWIVHRGNLANNETPVLADPPFAEECCEPAPPVLEYDPAGNLVYRLSGDNFNHVMATAAAVTVAEVEEVVPLGTIDPAHVHTPGIFVQRVVVGKDAAKPIEIRSTRPRTGSGNT